MLPTTPEKQDFKGESFKEAEKTKSIITCSTQLYVSTKCSQIQWILWGSDKRKLRKYEHTELPLDCEQDGKLTDVVSIIDEQFQDELEKIYAEADSHGLGSKLQEVWRTDAKRDKSNFLKDQSQNCEQ